MTACGLLFLVPQRMLMVPAPQFGCCLGSPEGVFFTAGSEGSSQKENNDVSTQEGVPKVD